MTTKCADIIDGWYPLGSDRPLIKRLAHEIDILSDEIEKLKGPTYGPMLEEEDDDTLTWNHEAPKPIGKVLKTEMTNDGVEFTVRPSTKEDE